MYGLFPCIRIFKGFTFFKKVLLECGFKFLCEIYLPDRCNTHYQSVVLNGQAPSWADVEAGVQQGPMLGPLLFLIYISDLSKILKLTVKLFADYTSIFEPCLSINIFQSAQFTHKIKNKKTPLIFLKLFSITCYAYPTNFSLTNFSMPQKFLKIPVSNISKITNSVE